MNLNDIQIELEQEALTTSIKKIKELQSKAVDSGRFAETNEVLYLLN